MQYHPDRNKAPDAEEKFKEISEAYAVLEDQTKRQHYDQDGHAGIDMRYSQEDIFKDAAPDIEDILRDFGVGGSGKGRSIFDIFSGGSERREGPRRGSDILYELPLDFMEAASGKTVNIEIPGSETCGTCHGSGKIIDAPCTTCHGSGIVQGRRKLDL